MDPVARLLALEDIRALKARYFRCMDTKDWAGFEAVFAPDAVLDMTGEMRTGGDAGDGYVRGAAAIAAFVRSHVDAVTTVHHGHMPELEITSATTARGTWAMEDVLRWPGEGDVMHLRGYGHYHETYVCLDGRWLIASSRLARLRVDFHAPPR